MPAYKKAGTEETQHPSSTGQGQPRSRAMAPKQALEVRFEDRTANKWSVSLREDVFDSFISHGGNTLHKVFGEGSLFSPLLFGKFFDPADAFPLWDFESEALLGGPRSSAAACNVDWLITDADYVLKAELPGLKKYDAQILVENGKVLEISGQWRHRETSCKDWRNGHWWEYGYVRRIELPENANWREIEANIDNHFLEIKIPKNISESPNMPQSSDVEPKDS
ncbi:hypothetical protein ACLOJK_020410 [Asimina triloba]